MKVYDENKTRILNDYDLSKGRLVQDKILVKTSPAQAEIKEQGHYEVIKTYEGGGKDVKWVVDIAGQEAKPETPVYEDIQVFIPYTEEEILDRLREQREIECFSIINRGQLWYIKLSEEQIIELNQWYHDWLNVTITKNVPEKPKWLT